jgi:hypothetical protein
VVDVDDPLASRLVEHPAQHLLAMLDPASPEVMAVDVQQVESVIDEPLGLPLRDGIVEEVEVRHAAVVRDRDLAVDHQLVADADKPGERGLEHWRPIVAVAAD